MAEWQNAARAKLTIITRGDISIVRISPASDLVKDTKEVRIPLEILKEMVNRQ